MKGQSIKLAIGILVGVVILMTTTLPNFQKVESNNIQNSITLVK